MGKSQQRKGAAGERELAALLGEHGYVCTRGGAFSFGDVPDVVGLPGVHIEVKRVEKLNVVEAMEQSIRDSDRMGDGVPALFHRRNRKPWLVTMRLEDWLPLYEGSAEYQQNTSNGRNNTRTKSERQSKTRAKPEQRKQEGSKREAKCKGSE